MNIKEVDAMTVQQAIEYSLDKIVKQGERCMRGGECAYGDGEGNHCAIGWLLDTNDGDLMEYEGSARVLLEERGEDVPKLIRENLDTFRYFQGFHDTSFVAHKVEYLRLLEDEGIDTSHANFQAWIDLGK